ncbi:MULTISPECIES: sugar ABC transporter permease [Rhizobium/Agrobacterium group]|uniref:Xylose transport system permease protein XylH n=2 Tax=Rhizobium/Agrobacterium group TaxID=227290 RepID=B9JTF1_ALLAM|nr:MULTISPECIES: sugar ABC transporter permease [Rhizobium/Agrobacterium group]ACM35864.1 ABC transporter membrane spanning protein (xylose) [Allorhizobium ampelinum S4]MCF1448344.1 sugar ABC transporter permease [Allorhizobium ampelinum]MCF1491981.1 sugar ABC transporter permease [Allorhizobium ampelinum]MUO30353.1 sugar ABC transporter permease [Agrobacterium vitis]MUO44655.1 sugar ABC transporter permease [Agrobacterium vitis]
MVDHTLGAASSSARPSTVSPWRRFLNATEIDTRLMGMVVALLLIWFGFHILSDGLFLTPRNLWNLSVQAASVSVMATGMVLVIVTRNIDLSVGSILGFVGMMMAVTQTKFLPQLLGYDHPLMWVLALSLGIVIGAAIGAFQGVIIAFLNVPSFIVTLGGLLVWRGCAWMVTSGATVAPMDTRFRLMGGGADGSIGATASWVVGIIACVFIVLSILHSRRQRKRFGFPLKPIWAEYFMGLIGCGAVLGSVSVLNSYYMPVNLARKYAEANNIAWPDSGLDISLGIAIPVLIALGIAMVMNFITNRTRFGRYVFAIGGNPEAAVLAGIKTRWVTVRIFALMGALCAIAAAISTARLNAATNAQGTLDELYTIAAAVIGGTSLAGGAGTIAGAVLGAIVMQSLNSGMVLLGMDTPLQSIVIGMVLVVAVWLDTVYRARTR